MVPSVQDGLGSDGDEGEREMRKGGSWDAGVKERSLNVRLGYPQTRPRFFLPGGEGFIMSLFRDNRVTFFIKMLSQVKGLSGVA